MLFFSPQHFSQLLVSIQCNWILSRIENTPPNFHRFPLIFTVDRLFIHRKITFLRSCLQFDWHENHTYFCPTVAIIMYYVVFCIFNISEFYNVHIFIFILFFLFLTNCSHKRTIVWTQNVQNLYKRRLLYTLYPFTFIIEVSSSSE